MCARSPSPGNAFWQFEFVANLMIIGRKRIQGWLTGVYCSGPALFIFGFTRNIHWPYAVSLATGNAAGAWLSVKISVKKGENAVKIGLSVAILLMAIKFFFMF